MVDVSVYGLVCPNRQKHISHCRIFVQLIVVDSDFRCTHVIPLFELSIIQLLKQHSVSMHCLFFEVADETVAKTGREKVCQEVEVPEYSLS